MRTMDIPKLELLDLVMEAALNELDLSTALQSQVPVPESVLGGNFQNSDQQSFKLLTKLAADRKTAQIAGLVDLVLALISKELCSPGTAHLLLESAVDLLPLTCVKELWNVFLTRKPSLISGLEAVRPPGTTLLRTLVALEKRLSSVLDSDLIAQINLYLFEAFKFPTKALVNIKSVPVSPPAIDFDRDHPDKEYITFWSFVEQFQNVPELLLSSRSISHHLDLATKVARMFNSDSRPAPHKSTLAPRTLLWDTDPTVFPAILSDMKVQRLVALQELVAIEAFLLKGPSTADPLLSENQFEDVKHLKAHWFKILLRLSSPDDMAVYKDFMLDDKEWGKWKAGGCKPVPLKQPPRPLSGDNKLEIEQLTPQNRMLSESLEALWDAPPKTVSGSGEVSDEDAKMFAELREKYGVPQDAVLPANLEKYFDYWQSEYETDLKSGWRWLAIRLMVGKVDPGTLAGITENLDTGFSEALVEDAKAALPDSSEKLPDYNGLGGTKRANESNEESAAKTAKSDEALREDSEPIFSETPRTVNSDEDMPNFTGDEELMDD